MKIGFNCFWGGALLLSRMRLCRLGVNHGGLISPSCHDDFGGGIVHHEGEILVIFNLTCFRSLSKSTRSAKVVAGAGMRFSWLGFVMD